MSRAEDIPLTKRSEFTFQWTIANLYMFGKPMFAGLLVKELLSSKFTVPSLENSEWYLRLELHEDNKSAMCFLHRTESGPENIKIFYSLSVGSLYSVENQRFGKDSSSIGPRIINILELGQKVELGLAKDVLIECRLWQSAGEFLGMDGDALTSPYPVFCSTRTVIPCEERNLLLPIKQFSTRIIGFIAGFCVDSAGKSNLMNFLCKLSYVSYTTKGKEFKLRFFKHNPQQSTSCVIKFRIQLVDAFKKLHYLIGGRFVYNSDSSEHVFLITTAMLEKKHLYMPGDILLLSCEFAVSDNKAVTFVESTRYDSSDIQAVNPVCGWDVYLDQKYNEHRFLFRLLAILVLIFSLFIPHLFANNLL